MRTDKEHPKTDISMNQIDQAIEKKADILNSKAQKPLTKSRDNNNKRRKRRTTKNEPQIAKICRFIEERYELRKDIVRNVFEVKDLSVDESEFEFPDNFHAELCYELMQAGFTKVKEVVNTILASSYVPNYHPIESYFENLPEWDGDDRLDVLVNSLQASNPKEQELLARHLKMHLIRCVKSVYVPGYFNKHCFTIIGTRQSMGKTTFIRNLLPSHLSNLRVELDIDADKKDTQIALGTNWVINMDELDSLERRDLGKLKSMLSKDNIKIRRPYAATDAIIPRLANFFASTNNTQFLNDLTGNVRWICFRITEIDFNYSNLNLDQVWAQILNYFKNNTMDAELSLKDRKDNNQRNVSFMIVDPQIEAIQQHFKPVDENIPGVEFLTATEIMKRLNNKGYSFRYVNSIGKALTALKFNRISKRLQGQENPIQCYSVVEESLDNTKF